MALAIDARQLDLATQRRRGEGDRHAGHKRGPVALEHRMTTDVDEDVQVAGRGAKRASLALAAQTDPGAGIDAGGNVDFQFLGLIDAAFAAALAARLFDDFAPAMAGGASAFDHEEALLRPHLPVAAAQVAAPRAGAGLGA